MNLKKLQPPQNWKIGHFKTSDDKRVRFAIINSCKKKNHGTVVLTGGYGLDIEYYRKAIKNWSKRGYKVYAMDLYGQGGSDREAPDAPGRPSSLGFEGHAEILHEFIQKIVRPKPHKTNILSAHSQSGGIVPVYLERYENNTDFHFDMAVLGSPLFAINTFGNTPGKLFRAFVYAADYFGYGNTALRVQPPARLKNIFKKAAQKAQSEIACNDNAPAKFRISFRNDQYPAEMDYPTISWFKSFFESQNKMTSAFFGAIETPVLIISPTEDEYVSVTAKHHAAEHMQNAQIVSIPDARHGIWYDRSRDIQKKLWQTIDQFVGRHKLGLHTPEAVVDNRDDKPAVEDTCCNAKKASLSL